MPCGHQRRQLALECPQGICVYRQRCAQRVGVQSTPYKSPRRCALQEIPAAQRPRNVATGASPWETIAITREFRFVRRSRAAAAEPTVAATRLTDLCATRFDRLAPAALRPGRCAAAPIPAPRLGAHGAPTHLRAGVHSTPYGEPVCAAHPTNLRAKSRSNPICRGKAAFTRPLRRRHPGRIP